MPNVQTLGKIVRFILVAMTGMSVMKRLLPASVVEYLQSDTGLQEVAEVAVALITLLWSFYVGWSKDIGLKIAAQAEAGTPVEEIKAQTAAMNPYTKAVASIKGTPIEEVIAAHEAKAAEQQILKPPNDEVS